MFQPNLQKRDGSFRCLANWSDHPIEQRPNNLSNRGNMRSNMGGRAIWGAIWRGAIWGATNEANGWGKPHFATLQTCKLHLQETFWMWVHDVTKCNLRSKILGQKASWIRLSRMGKQSKDATLEIEDIRRQPARHRTDWSNACVRLASSQLDPFITTRFWGTEHKK